MVVRATDLLSEVVDFLDAEVFFGGGGLYSQRLVSRQPIVPYLPILHCLLQKLERSSQSIEEHIIRISLTLSFIRILQVQDIHTLHIQSL